MISVRHCLCCTFIIEKYAFAHTPHALSIYYLDVAPCIPSQVCSVCETTRASTQSKHVSSSSNMMHGTAHIHMQHPAPFATIENIGSDIGRGCYTIVKLFASELSTSHGLRPLSAVHRPPSAVRPKSRCYCTVLRGPKVLIAFSGWLIFNVQMSFANVDCMLLLFWFEYDAKCDFQNPPPSAFIDFSWFSLFLFLVYFSNDTILANAIKTHETDASASWVKHNCFLFNYLSSLGKSQPFSLQVSSCWGWKCTQKAVTDQNPQSQ